MRMSAASFAIRHLAGLVVALSLVLSFAPATVAATGLNAPDAQDSAGICHIEANIQGTASGHAHCGGAGHGGCVAHSGCMVFTLPGAPLDFIRSGPARWAWPNADRHAGLSILPATPPPRSAA